MPILGDVALGVASSMVFEIIKKPINVISSELSRRDSVNRALSDKQSPRQVKNERDLDTIVADLARIIGNSQGALSEDVAHYLRELRRTAIPDAIAQLVLCGHAASELLPAFEEFHSRFENIEFTASQLLNALYAATSNRLEDVSDKSLLEIIRAQHSEVIVRVGQLVSSITRENGTTNNITIEEIKDCRIKVARLIEGQNKLTTVETLHGSKRLNLKSLSIPPRVVKLGQSHIQSAKVPTDQPTITYSTFRKNFDKAVLLGDPGGGKSTLTQLLSYDLANWLILESGNPARREFEPRDLKMPLRLVLRTFEARQLKAPSYTLFEFMRDEIKPALDNDPELARRFLSYVLKIGEAILIFDGLDEVLDVGSRRSLVNQIEQFSEIYAACPVLVTSRLVGYRDAPLAEDFAPYGLSRFNVEEINKYSAKAIKAVERISLSEAKDKSLDFVSQTNRVGGDIRENPLMLGLMVQIYVFRGDVPSNRPEVYRECAMLMFEKWDGRREIKPDIPRDELELLDVFGYVASRTFGNADYEDGVTKSWLQGELRRHFDGWYIDKASANKAAKSLVEFLTGRAWVMSEVGREVFKFTHRTFLEYFFARNLISESRSIDDLFNAHLLPHIIKNEWVVIGHLAFHMAIFRDGGKSRQAAEAIEKNLRELKLVSHEEFPFLEFVANALEYIVIPEASYVNIVRLAMARVMQLGAHENFNAVNIINSLHVSSKTRERLAIDAICETLDRGLSDPTRPEFNFSVYCLGARRQAPHVRGRHILSQQNLGGLHNAFQEFRSKKREIVYTAAKLDRQLARAYIYTYNDSRANLYKKHGASLLEASPSTLYPPEMDYTLALSLSYASHMLLRRRRERGNDIDERLRDSIEFHKMVATDIADGKIGAHHLLVTAKDGFALIEAIFDSVFHDIYIASRGIKLRADTADAVGDIMLCGTALSEAYIESNDTIKKRNRPRDMFIPYGAIQEILRSITASRHFELLSRNLQERMHHKEDLSK